MINRALIRIKVVQILYSYLLSRSEFQIIRGPQGTSRDRNFSYAVYLDMLMLIQELSGIRVSNPDRQIPAIDVNKYLRTNRVGRALADNATLRGITAKNAAHLNLFGPYLQKLSDKITASAAFQDYSKKRSRSLDDDVKFWVVELDTLILKDKELTEIMRKSPEFSLAGWNRGIQEAVNTLESYNDSLAMYAKAKSDLKASLDKAYELYYSLFALILDLAQEQNMRYEAAKSKYLAKNEDLNPNMRFVDNALVRMLEEDPTLQEYRKNPTFNWVDQPALLSSLLDSIVASQYYEEYTANEDKSRAVDAEFWRTVMRNIILPADSFAEAMESKSIFWNDDISVVGTFVLKTLRRFAGEADEAPLEFLPQFKDDEDAEFGAKLFTYAVDNREKYREYIDNYISQGWDPDRLAFMDIVVMLAAIAEIINFPNIPIPVTLNEYIEIANDYSTRRSGQFINGLLYSVISRLVEDGVVLKPFTVQPKPEK